MKNKLWILALLLIVTGTLLALATLLVCKFQFSALADLRFEEKILSLEDAEINAIEIETDFFDVTLVPLAVGEKPYVRFGTCEQYFHEIAVTDGKLSVRAIDRRSWYERFGIFSVSDELEVIELHLPVGSYQSFTVNADTGDVCIRDSAFLFESTEVHLTTGDVALLATVNSGCQVSVSTGDVLLQNVTGGALFVSTSTGDVALSDCTPSSFILSCTSGSITLSNVLAENFSNEIESNTGDITLTNVVGGEGSFLKINTTAGDVTLERCDFGSLYANTTTGDVTMTLLSGKRFTVNTNTGDLDYPDSIEAGGVCDVNTTTGDVAIKIHTAVVAQ